MSRDDWFRNTEWNAEIEANFDARLRRARHQKPQYLKIQAGALTGTHPDVALRLLDRYFELGDTFFLADAYSIQAHARLASGDVSGAIDSYRAALTREVEFPSLRTNSYTEYPLLVAERGLAEYYDDALQVLDARQGDLAFPAQNFMWHAAKALIFSAQGDAQRARVEARTALKTAGATSSGFRNHPSLGLVGESHGQLRERLRALSA